MRSTHNLPALNQAATDPSSERNHDDISTAQTLVEIGFRKRCQIRVVLNDHRPFEAGLKFPQYRQMMPAKARRPKEHAVKGKETWQPDTDTPNIGILWKYSGAVGLHDRAKAVKSCCRLEWDAFLDHHAPANKMGIKVKRSDLDVADAEFNSDEIGARCVYAHLN